MELRLYNNYHISKYSISIELDTPTRDNKSCLLFHKEISEKEYCDIYNTLYSKFHIGDDAAKIKTVNDGKNVTTTIRSRYVLN